MPVVEVDTIAEQGVTFGMLDATGGDDEVGMMVAVDVDEGGAVIVGLGDVGPGLVRRGGEGAIRLSEIERTGLAGRAGDEYIVAAIAIDVGRGQGGSESVEAARQQALTGELVKRAQRARVFQPARVIGAGVERMGVRRAR